MQKRVSLTKKKKKNEWISESYRTIRLLRPVKLELAISCGSLFDMSLKTKTKSREAPLSLLMKEMNEVFVCYYSDN